MRPDEGSCAATQPSGKAPTSTGTGAGAAAEVSVAATVSAVVVTVAVAAAAAAFWASNLQYYRKLVRGMQIDRKTMKRFFHISELRQRDIFRIIKYIALKLA